MRAYYLLQMPWRHGFFPLRRGPCLSFFARPCFWEAFVRAGAVRSVAGSVAGGVSPGPVLTVAGTAAAVATAGAGFGPVGAAAVASLAGALATAVAAWQERRVSAAVLTGAAGTVLADLALLGVRMSPDVRSAVLAAVSVVVGALMHLSVVRQHEHPAPGPVVAPPAAPAGPDPVVRPPGGLEGRS